MINFERKSPFFALQFGKRMRFENMVAGLIPWALLTLLELAACVVALYRGSMDMTWYLIAGEVFLLGPFLGYFAQLQGVCCVKNIIRRVQYDELMVLPVNADDFLQFSLRKVFQASRLGLFGNFFLGTVPLAIFSLIYTRPSLIGWIPAVTILKMVMGSLFLRHSMLIGIEHLLLVKGYIKSCIPAMGRIVGEIYIGAAFTYCFLNPLTLMIEIKDLPVLATLIFLIVIYTIYLFRPGVRSLTYKSAYDAIEKWRMHEKEEQELDPPGLGVEYF